MSTFSIGAGSYKSWGAEHCYLRGLSSFMGGSGGILPQEIFEKNSARRLNLGPKHSITLTTEQ